MLFVFLITSPAGAVVKYCDEQWACLCVSVCVSVCPRGYLRNHERDIYHYCACCLWPCLGPPTAWLRNPKGRGNFEGFLPHWQCIVQHSIWDPYKNGWTDRDAVWVNGWAWPEEQCVTWGWRSLKGKWQFLGKHVPDKPNTSNNCELDWSMQRHTTGADASLQALDESIIGREVGGGIAHRGRSLIPTIAFFL